MILAALNGAQIAGARLGAVCQVIGVSARTIQRWKRHPEVGAAVTVSVAAPASGIAVATTVVVGRDIDRAMR